MSKVFYFFVIIFFYCSSILACASKPIEILIDHQISYMDTNMLCCILSMISFFFISKCIKIKKKIFSHIVLFFMMYFALVLGNNKVFDFLITKIIKYYEIKNLIDSYQYEQLWDIWSNDLSRNLMYFYGLFYSLFASFFYFWITKIFYKFLKKPQKNNKNE